MNLHIVHDNKFIDKTYKLFEQYYPGENFFIALFPKKNIKTDYDGNLIEINFFSLYKLKSIFKLLNKNKGENDINILIHNLSKFKALLVALLSNRYEVNIYWIFYGVDLYDELQDMGVYKLTDGEANKYQQSSFSELIKSNVKFFLFKILTGKTAGEVKTELIKKIDYFCFWNHYDYKLLREYYQTDAEFKYFRYYEAIPNKFDIQITVKNKKADTVLVNHSASASGNHLTVLKKLKKVDRSRRLKEVYTPLSYGRKTVVDEVIDFGSNELPWCFNAITEFIPKEEYLKLLRTTPSAVFGQKRQAGAGSVFHLLASGAKVFLRNDNNFLAYLREKGYKVFCFETDLNKYEDLFSMSYKDQLHNYNLAFDEFSKEEIDKTYLNLIER